ncbi:MAG: DNA helicase, partial [Chitinophagaceae bacterium]
VAGSGKTTTIIEYASSRPKDSRILYLAFNRSVKTEAKKKFQKKNLKNVQIETAHSLAYNFIVRGGGYKISTAGYTSFDVARILSLSGNGEKHGEYILANHILKFLTYFCNSSVARVQDLDYRKTISDQQALTFVTNFYDLIEKGTRVLLGMMHKGEIDITHDFYLKMFQLSAPRLSYDYILFDEGQDASPAMLDVFLNQAATKIIVGDTNQQIYGWRHATNSLEMVDYPAFDLSTSFRFGDNVSRLAMDVLQWKKYLQNFDPVKISGCGSAKEIKSRATISRTNLGLLVGAITFIKENPKTKDIYFEGNFNSYTYADEGASLYDVLNLYNGRRGQIRDRLIASMNGMKELEEYISKTEDRQLGMMVDVVKEYGNEIPSLLQQLKSLHVSDDEKEKAEMIFSTVHRAKGMEYDEVRLTDDFVTETELRKLPSEVKEDVVSRGKWNEEVNLLYVAITRTKKKLIIPEIMLPLTYFDETGKIASPLPAEVNTVEELGKAITHAKNPAKKKRGEEKEPAYSYTEKRLKNKNAYERWTAESDAELKAMFYKGAVISVLCEHFGRNKGAILSRLKKIGCDSFD